MVSLGLQGTSSFVNGVLRDGQIVHSLANIACLHSARMRNFKVLAVLELPVIITVQYKDFCLDFLILVAEVSRFLISFCNFLSLSWHSLMVNGIVISVF